MMVLDNMKLAKEMSIIHEIQLENHSKFVIFCSRGLSTLGLYWQINGYACEVDIQSDKGSDQCQSWNVYSYIVEASEVNV